MRAFGLLALLCFGVVSAAQESVPRNPEGLLDVKKPSVYLTFERTGPRAPKFKTESKVGVWLRLRNNTTRPIALYGGTDAKNATDGKLADGALAAFAVDGTEFNLCYDVDAVPIFTSRTIRTGNEVHLEIGVPYKAHAPDQSSLTSCYWWNPGDVGGRPIWLKAGQSVVFSVPKNFLAKDLRIATEISYEWESENGYIFHDEPRHLVYFNYFDLEEATQKPLVPPKP